MSLDFNIYFKNKAEAILSHIVMGLSHYSFNCSFKSTRQWWFLLGDQQPTPLPSRRAMARRPDRKVLGGKGWGGQGQPETKPWACAFIFSALFLGDHPSVCLAPRSPLSLSSQIMALTLHYLLSLSLSPDTILQSKLFCCPFSWSRATCKIRKHLLGFSWLPEAAKS